MVAIKNILRVYFPTIKQLQIALSKKLLDIPSAFESTWRNLIPPLPWHIVTHWTTKTHPHHTF